MSSPSNITRPSVASISRVRQRTSVDFPLPESPITTNTSPGGDTEADIPKRNHEAHLILDLGPALVGVLRLHGPVRLVAEHFPQTLYFDLVLL